MGEDEKEVSVAELVSMPEGEPENETEESQEKKTLTVEEEIAALREELKAEKEARSKAEKSKEEGSKYIGKGALMIGDLRKQLQEKETKILELEKRLEDDKYELSEKEKRSIGKQSDSLEAEAETLKQDIARENARIQVTSMVPDFDKNLPEIIDYIREEYTKELTDDEELNKKIEEQNRFIEDLLKKVKEDPYQFSGEKDVQLYISAGKAVRLLKKVRAEKEGLKKKPEELISKLDKASKEASKFRGNVSTDSDETDTGPDLSIGDLYSMSEEEFAQVKKKFKK